MKSSSLSNTDVIYPPSMEGPWQCRRQIVRVEGDTFQAESAFRCLGYDSSNGKLVEGAIETFDTKLIKPNLNFDNQRKKVVVVDRGYEMVSRTRSTNVQWSVDDPNVLQHNKIQLVVVQRKVEPPSDQGFGFDELLRVEDGIVTRAIQVKRRYRRAFDETGNRVVEGLELVKTFRVLDGIAGTEFPTSTTKSQLRLTRPGTMTASLPTST